MIFSILGNNANSWFDLSNDYLGSIENINEAQTVKLNYFYRKVRRLQIVGIRKAKY